MNKTIILVWAGAGIMLGLMFSALTMPAHGQIQSGFDTASDCGRNILTSGFDGFSMSSTSWGRCESWGWEYNVVAVNASGWQDVKGISFDVTEFDIVFGFMTFANAVPITSTGSYLIHDGTLPSNGYDFVTVVNPALINFQPRFNYNYQCGLCPAIHHHFTVDNITGHTGQPPTPTPPPPPPNDFGGFGLVCTTTQAISGTQVITLTHSVTNTANLLENPSVEEPNGLGFAESWGGSLVWQNEMAADGDYSFRPGFDPQTIYQAFQTVDLSDVTNQENITVSFGLSAFPPVAANNFLAGFAQGSNVVDQSFLITGDQWVLISSTQVVTKGVSYSSAYGLFSFGVIMNEAFVGFSDAFFLIAYDEDNQIYCPLPDIEDVCPALDCIDSTSPITDTPTVTNTLPIPPIDAGIDSPTCYDCSATSLGLNPSTWVQWLWCRLLNFFYCTLYGWYLVGKNLVVGIANIFISFLNWAMLSSINLMAWVGGIISGLVAWLGAYTNNLIVSVGDTSNRLYNALTGFTVGFNGLLAYASILGEFFINLLWVTWDVIVMIATFSYKLFTSFVYVCGLFLGLIDSAPVNPLVDCANAVHDLCTFFIWTIQITDFTFGVAGDGYLFFVNAYTGFITIPVLFWMVERWGAKGAALS